MKTWEVTDDNGVLYRSPQGGRLVRLSKGAKVTEKDIESGAFTMGGVESMVKLKRLKPLSEAPKNKKMPESK